MSQADATSDEEFMTAYRLGDEHAFERLYLRHSAKVWSYLGKRVPDPVLREDIFQAVFLKLHRSRRQYDSKQLFLPWLFTICRTVMIDALRAKRLEEVTEPEVLDSIAAPEVENNANRPIDLDSLVPLQKVAIELRYSEEKSFEEIATALRTSPSNARQLVSRGVRALRTLLAGSEGKTHD